MECGTYRIRNTITGDFYIGSSINIYQRWRKHKEALRRGNNGCLILQNAWNKYGEEAFVFEVIEFCSVEERLDKEQILLDELSPPYNIAKSARSPSVGRRFRLPEEAKQKISKGNKGKKRTLEQCKAMSEARKGKPLWTVDKERYEKRKQHLAKLSAKQRKPIERICLTTGIVTEYESVAAARKEWDVVEIYKVLKGKRESYKGAGWQYL